MASSGSFNTSSYGSGDWQRYVQFAWEVSSQSIANNTTRIYWRITGKGGATNNYYVSGPFEVVINGSTVYSSSSRINLWNGTTVADGHVTISHKSDGTKSFSASCEAAIYSYSMNVSGSGSWDLPTIPRQATVTAATNFNDTGNPTITYSNPAGTAVTTLQAGIYNTAGTTAYAAYRNISKTGTSYTFELTDAERNALLAATPNSKTMTVRFYVKTIIGGNTFTSYKQATMTVVNGNPTFSKSYKDTNATTTAITLNNQKIIRNQSTLQVKMTSCTAKKSATLASAICEINGVTSTATISSGTATFNIGQLDESSNTTATLTLTDSRGFSTTKTVSITVINWELPSAIITLHRANNYYTPTDITVDGSISSVDGKNTMTIQMRYKEADTSTWTAWTTMQDNVTQTFQLDNTKSWDIQVKITDLFGTTTYNASLGRGTPIIYFDDLKSSVGVNCFPTGMRSLEVNGSPVDRNVMTCKLTSTIANPTAGDYTKLTLANGGSTGERLTFYSGGVKIGAGVSKVMVSAQMTITPATQAGICHLRVVKNNDENAHTLAWTKNIAPVGSPTAIAISSVLVPVTENDVINLYYYVPNSDDAIEGNQVNAETVGSNTWMTVDVAG